MELICNRESFLVIFHLCLSLSKVLKAEGASKVDRGSLAESRVLKGGPSSHPPRAHLVQAEPFSGMCSSLTLATAPGFVMVTSDPLS